MHKPLSISDGTEGLTMTKGELQDELKARDKRIEELRAEIDDLRDLNQRMGENVEDWENIIERWKEAFDMVLDDDGKWSWNPFLMELLKHKAEAEITRREHNELVEKHNALVQKWNRKLLIGHQPVGRPLAASESQIAQVLNLRAAGTSLRAIAEETSLGLNTVRTIVDKKQNAGRAGRRARMLMRSMKASGWEADADEIERDPDERKGAIKFRRQKRAIDALPKQIERVIEDGRALVKEAKGLGRGK
jgi:DNA repair exonuclease SbcCD ATPase subunit